MATFKSKKTAATKATKAADPVIDIFAAAQVIAQPEPKAKSKKSDKLVLEAESNVELFGAINAVVKSLEGIKDTLGDEIKEEGIDKFIALGRKGGIDLPKDLPIELRKRPDNFVFESENTRTSVELRKRTSRSPLSDDEIQALSDIPGFDVDTIDVDENVLVEAKYIFNPALMTQENMKLLSKLIGSEPSLAGIVQYQAESKTTTRMASDESINAAFRTKTADGTREALKILTVSALKPSLKNELGLEPAIDLLREALTPDEDAE